MKYKMMLAAAALTMMGVTAQAQLSVKLDQNVLSASSAVDFFVDDPSTQAYDPMLRSIVPFAGSIVNDGPDTITLLFDSVGVPAGAFGDLPNAGDAFIPPSFPLELEAGTEFRADYLFGVDLQGLPGFGVNPDGTLVNPLDGFFYTIFGEDEKGTSFSAEAQYGIAGVPAVPEPGAMALLFSGLVGGSLFLARRRK